MAEERKVITLGPPQFSSPDPATMENSMFHGTSAKRVVGLNDDAVPVHDPEEDAGMKAADWISEVEAADTQEQLDEVASRYAAAGKTFATVEKAVEKKQGEITAAGEADNTGDDAGNGQ